MYEAQPGIFFLTFPTFLFLILYFGALKIKLHKKDSNLQKRIKTNTHNTKEPLI